MRVIGGQFRSRRLFEVESADTRETKDRVKESIFNSIQSHLYDAMVLDLFAGSGSLGIEAMSRNAAHTTFVDSQMGAIRTIQKNVSLFNIENRVDIHHNDAFQFLQQTTKTYDIILLDPPYHLKIINEIVSQIAMHQLLRDDGVIVCLYSKNDELLTENHGIISYKTKTMGITKITYMKWGE